MERDSGGTGLRTLIGGVDGCSCCCGGDEGERRPLGLGEGWRGAGARPAGWASARGSFLSADAVVAAAAAVEAEEERARTADGVAHGARGAREAGETEVADRQTAPARSPATRGAGEPSCP